MEEECAKAGVSPKELIHGGRRDSVSRVRSAIAYRCVEEIGTAAAEIARHLGVTTSSITRAIERAQERRRK